MNLLPINALDAHNINVAFKNGVCVLIDGNDSNIIGSGFKRDDCLYQIDGSIAQNPNHIVDKSQNLSAAVCDETSVVLLWLRHFGHTNKDTIKKVSKDRVISGINLHDVPKKITYQPCLDRKQNRKPF